jgi:hypothetical protein
VALDPANREAVGDLFDYYLGAPGFLGSNKAESLAQSSAAIPPKGITTRRSWTIAASDSASALRGGTAPGKGRIPRIFRRMVSQGKRCTF